MVKKNTNGMYPALCHYGLRQYGLEHPKGNDKFKHEREEFQTRRD
jgi:hypothetical protein